MQYQKNDLFAYIKTCFFFFTCRKNNSYTRDETRSKICIMFRILATNYNSKKKGNCKVLVSCFLCLKESQVKVVALCAGSGSSVLQGVKADLYLTGEMSHHDILDAASQGINVILCEHSNTERGFLSDLRDMLDSHLENKINIILSETDRDPLQVV